MVFHVGIDPIQGKVAAFDETKKQTIKFEIERILPFPWEMTKVDIIFKQIKFKIKEKFGCVSICLFNAFTNDFRVKILETAKENGFTKIQIIDFLTELYLTSMSQANFMPQIGDVIWLFWQNTCYIWQKFETKAKMIKLLSNYPSGNNALKEIKDASGIDKDPNIIIFDKYFKQKRIRSAFKKCKHFFLENFQTAEATLLKARILVEDSEVLNYDVEKWLEFDVRVKVNGEMALLIPENRSMPLEETICVPIKFNEKFFKVVAEIADNPFKLHEILSGNITISPEMSKNKEILFKFKIDENYISSIEILKTEMARRFFKKIYAKAFGDEIIANDQIFGKNSEDFLSPKLLFKKDECFLTYPSEGFTLAIFSEPLFISFVEEKPIVGEDAKKMLEEKPSFVLYDLLKLCSINDPSDADPKWQFEVKISDDNKLLIEFDTKNGRRKSSPAFIMALIIRDLMGNHKVNSGVTLKELQAIFCDVEKNENLIATLNEAASLVKFKFTFP